MENERLTEKEAAALLTAARCHRENLEGICSAMVRHGDRGGKTALAREIQTLASVEKKLQKMIKEDRQCEEK